jgi:xanthine dehydrogenase accessory factor
LNAPSPDEILEAMAALLREGVPFVAATVIASRGSTPRKAGARMVVAADGRLLGTVGGGAVESRVIERCRALLEAPEVERLSWELASEEAGGMVCGGAMEFLLEPFGVRPRAFVFGAGHVSQALCRVLADVGFARTVVDRRADQASAVRFPGATCVLAEPAAAAREVPVGPRDFCVVVNPTHGDDLEVLRALAPRSWAYLGLMASLRKRATILQALRDEGVPEAVLARIRTPVGLPIGAETPAEIALSIAAEMVAVLRRAPLPGVAAEPSPVPPAEGPPGPA